MSGHSEQLNDLAAALTKAQGEFPKVAKNEEGKIKGESKNGSNYEYSYKYADLATVVETVQPVLSKHGLAVSQFISVSDGGKDTLTTWLLHESGQYISSSMRLYLRKDDAQGQGSAVSYARRYSYMAVLGLVTDDDDGAAASSPKSRSAPHAYIDNTYVDLETGESFSPQTRQSRPAIRQTTNKVAAQAQADPETGEVPTPLSELIEKLSQDHRKTLDDKMKAANFPPLADLPGGAQKQVRKWIADLQAEQDKGANF